MLNHNEIATFSTTRLILVTGQKVGFLFGLATNVIAVSEIGGYKQPKN
jgi:hypothetical protein